MSLKSAEKQLSIQKGTDAPHNNHGHVARVSEQGGVAPISTGHSYKPDFGCSHSLSASTITKHKEAYESGRLTNSVPYNG